MIRIGLRHLLFMSRILAVSPGLSAAPVTLQEPDPEEPCHCTATFDSSLASLVVAPGYDIYPNLATVVSRGASGRKYGFHTYTPD